jgi:Cu+-exporting ATPase
VGVYVSIQKEKDSFSFENQRRVIGVLGIIDSIQEDAKTTVLALQSLKIDVWMCTGDHNTTARAVARQVGIPETNICANVTPKGKGDLVTRLQQRKINRSGPITCCNRRIQNGKVAMIGDGINDSVALARADVGIAIGAGTEAAMKAADIVLVKSDLHDVVVALHLSRRVFGRIKANFVWAMGYNLFAIPFAAGVFYHWTEWRVPPAFAGFMMAFSSVSVVTSSLFLKCYSKPRVDEAGKIVGQGLFSFIRRCLVSTLFRIVSICSTDKKKSPPAGGWESVIV